IDDCINTNSWDTERLAFMDVIITMTALSEIINFPKIPLVVSINEYIEIAKSYSTSKSGAFVNGLLSTIVGRLREEGKISKM
ncbi:MAG: transcription antitermination factor NusB, partial [Muribaculaceae bacterium]|nr:transcription antitermination factor NusB [Muribaculaceae bacterium]